jgi:GntR family transcriptional repressor for pyruvate dehydrogenase complex
MDVLSNLGVTPIRPAYEQVAVQLRTRILDGTMKPGERLPVESQLAASFGVSRTTIREALRTLNSQDLVYTARGVNGGTFVAPVDAKGFVDNMESRLGLMATNDVITAEELIEVRILIEVPSARLAASRRTREDLDALRLAAEGNEVSGTREERGHHSRDFHMAVVWAAHNVLLSSIAAPIFSVWRQLGLSTTDGWNEIDHEHYEVIEAIERGDGEAAARLTELHLVKMRASSEADTPATAAAGV